MNETALRPDAAQTRPSRTPAPRGEMRAGGSYSRFVVLMKVVLPISAGVLALMIVIWPQIEKQSEGFRLGFAAVTPDDAKGQRIVNARYTGIDRDGRPFTLTADSAVQADNDAPVQLEYPKADITLGNGAWVALSADGGTYRKRVQMLDLEGNVSGFHDQGYEFTTARARVDLETGTASGTMPVAGHGPLGEINGQGFELDDQGKRIVFTGKSRLLIYPNDKTGGKDKR